MEFSRPEYWSVYPFPSPGDLPNPGIEPRSPALQADSLPAEPQGFSLLYILILTCVLFDDIPFWQVWDDISLWFWLIFPWWLSMLTIFSCACWPSAFLFWRNVYLGLLPIFKSGCSVFFFFLLLNCMRCLYIFDINPLLVISFANIFSHSVGCLFIWSMVSFPVQKLLHLIRSHLFIFAFIFFALGNRSKKQNKTYCHNLRQRMLCLCKIAFLWVETVWWECHLSVWGGWVHENCLRYTWSHNSLGKYI